MLQRLKRLAKKMLAMPMFRKAYEATTRVLLEIFSSNRVLAALYSIAGLLTFSREQYAVLRGRRNYYRNLVRSRQTHVELRRNIHRLEKGMIMRPRRDTFAGSYITETIEFYERAILQRRENPKSIDQSEVEWAHDVLARYFSVVKTGTSRIDEARQRFEILQKVFKTQGGQKKAPYLRKDSIKSAVSYDEMLKLAMQRRSTRWFLPKKVPRDLVDQALLVARQSPTACNRLPYQFKIFDDPALVKQVATIPFGTTGYAHQIPMIIVAVGKLESYFSPRDRHAIYIDASMAAMAFMFALETLGLSSCGINWPDFEPLEIKMQRKLGLDTSERVVMLIAVGYADPDGGIPYSQKKDLSIIRTYNEAASE